MTKHYCKNSFDPMKGSWVSPQIYIFYFINTGLYVLNVEVYNSGFFNYYFKRNFVKWLHIEKRSNCRNRIISSNLVIWDMTVGNSHAFYDKKIQKTWQTLGNFYVLDMYMRFNTYSMTLILYTSGNKNTSSFNSKDGKCLTIFISIKKGKNWPGIK
jgi:hypothetical protein